VNPNELLRQLLRILPDAIPIGLVQEIDLEAVEAINRHGLAGIARGAIGEGLSQQGKNALAGSAIEVAARAERVRGAFERAHRALNDAGISSVALKGRALATRLWADPSLRPSSDVDVLIRENDLDAAMAALGGAGYRPSPTEDLRHALEHHHHIELFDAQGGPPVELHFKASGELGVAIPTGALFERARAYEIDGIPIRLLSPEDEWLYLSVHAAVHAFTPLYLLLDLKFLARQKLDVDQVLARAGEWRARTAASVAARLVRRWCAVDLPALEGGARAQAVAWSISDALLGSATFVRSRRLTNLTALALTDSPWAAAGNFAYHTAKGLRRRIRDAARTVTRSS
jgi:hypothetical protein